MPPLSATSQHKRRLSFVESTENSFMTATGNSELQLPQLPQITGDIVLETFAHKSLNLLRSDGATLDNCRLSELGKTVVHLAATNHLYNKKPEVSAQDISADRESILSPENIEKWISHYNLRQRLRYNHSDSIDILSHEESEGLLYAYAGAVYSQKGHPEAINWIMRLIDPKSKSIISPVEDGSHRESKRIREDSPPPTTAPPSILPPQTVAQLPSTGLVNKAPSFLSLFNERCSQLYLKCEYSAENLGSPHAPIWHIRCFVNNILKGAGRGSSKQNAKEAAAKEAFYAMGWGDYGVHSLLR